MSNIRFPSCISAFVVVREIARRDGISSPISPDGFYKFLTYFSGKREQPRDRPTDRTSDIIARSGYARQVPRRKETSDGARERKAGVGEKGRVRSKIFHLPPRFLFPLCNRAPSLAYKEKGNCGERLRGVAFYNIAPLSGLRFRRMFLVRVPLKEARANPHSTAKQVDSP